MMKKYNKIIMAVMAVLIMSLGIFTGTCKAAGSSDTDGKKYVFDNAGILSDEEESKLQSECEKASRGCETDIIIVTDRTGLDYYDLDNHARDIINTSFGYNPSASTPDAILYFVDMKSRADRIITSGKAKTDISQSRLDTIREKSEKKLTKAKYYDAFKAYISNVEQSLNTSMAYRLTLYMPAKLGIALAIAVIAVLIMMHSAKARMTVNSSTYMEPDSCKINDRRDIFINTTVVERHIDTSSGDSGGGGGGGGNSGSSGGHF